MKYAQKKDKRKNTAIIKKERKKRKRKQLKRKGNNKKEYNLIYFRLLIRFFHNCLLFHLVRSTYDNPEVTQLVQS